MPQRAGRAGIVPRKNFRSKPPRARRLDWSRSGERQTGAPGLPTPPWPWPRSSPFEPCGCCGSGACLCHSDPMEPEQPCLIGSTLVSCIPNRLQFAARDFRLPRGDERRAYPHGSVMSEQRSGSRKELRPFGLRLKCPRASLLVGHRPLSGMLPPSASPWGILGATNCKLFGIHNTRPTSQQNHEARQKQALRRSMEPVRMGPPLEKIRFTVFVMIILFSGYIEVIFFNRYERFRCPYPKAIGSHPSRLPA
jgi:hypothetical protein